MKKPARLRYAIGAAALAIVLLITIAPGADLSLSPVAEPDIENLLYMPEPGQDVASESDNLMAMGDYFYHRVSYPTGQFDGRWYLEAKNEDAQIERAVPAGEVTYDRAASQSPLALDPNSFTSLGPKPLQSIGCQSCYSYGLVSGRVNVMAIDPVEPTVAYLGSDGGGVWKTTNCCSAATTWTTTTDDPLLSTIAIGDITIDPNNHNVVYAGTGDLRFGSFSFGAAGVLKSSDQGATWEVLGADVFNSVYTQPPGVYPQYQAIGKVRVDPRNSDNLAVGTKTGVFFSYDAGANWDGPCVTNAYTDQRQDVTGLLTTDTGSNTRLYAFVGARGFNTTVQPDLNLNGANGAYSTTWPASGCPASWDLLSRPDNGWPADTASGTPYASYNVGNQLGRLDVAMAPSDPDVIYVQVQAIHQGNGTQRGGQLGVWRTTDGGVTWQQRSSPSVC